jgi:hypothetical protein
MYETEEWHTFLNEVKMFALNSAPNTSAMAIVQSPSSHVQQRQKVPSTLTRTVRKIEDILGEDQFGFRTEKRTRAADWILRTISE